MDERAPEVGADVQRQLAALRDGLYARRGPELDEAALARNMSLRHAVGGVPTATRREDLHLRTLKIRGFLDEAAEEAAWAAAQFKGSTPKSH